MKLLVSHGFYLDGRLFELEIGKEYNRRHGPLEEEVTFRSIVHPAQRGDSEGEAAAHSEIADILEKDRPCAFINLETLRGKPISQQEMRQSPVGELLSRLGHNLAREKSFTIQRNTSRSSPKKSSRNKRYAYCSA